MHQSSSLSPMGCLLLHSSSSLSALECGLLVPKWVTGDRTDVNASWKKKKCHTVLKVAESPVWINAGKKKMRAHIKVEISDFFQQIETTDNTVSTVLHGNTPLKPTSNCFLRWVLSMLLDFYDLLFSLRWSMSGSISSTGTAVLIKAFSLSAPIVKLLKSNQNQSKEQFLLWRRPQTWTSTSQFQAEVFSFSYQADCCLRSSAIETISSYHHRKPWLHVTQAPSTNHQYPSCLDSSQGKENESEKEKERDES